MCNRVIWNFCNCQGTGSHWGRRGQRHCVCRVAGWEAGDEAFFHAQVGASSGQSSVFPLHSTFLPPVTPHFASGQVLLSALALNLQVAPDKALLVLSSPGHHPAFCESDLHSSTGDEWTCVWLHKTHTSAEGRLIY